MSSKDINAARHMISHCERIERYLKLCDNSIERFMNDELPAVKHFFENITA